MLPGPPHGRVECGRKAGVPRGEERRQGGVAGGPLRKGPAIMEGRPSADCPLTRPERRAGVLSGGLVTRCGPDCPSLPVADLRRCLPHPPQRASRGDQLRLPGDKHVGLAKDSGGRNGVPTLSPLAGCGAHVGKQAEEGQGLASQTWLTHARARARTHTHTPHRLEESLAQLTQTVLSSGCPPLDLP